MDNHQDDGWTQPFAVLPNNYDPTLIVENRNGLIINNDEDREHQNETETPKTMAEREKFKTFTIYTIALYYSFLAVRAGLGWPRISINCGHSTMKLTFDKVPCSTNNPSCSAKSIQCGDGEKEGIGTCSSIFNPTLVQLSHIFQTNLEAVSIVFPLRAIGCVFGTLTNGFLNVYCNRQILLISFIILKALTAFLVPHWTSINQFYVNGFFNGFFTAAIVVMVNVWLNEMWSGSNREKQQEDQRIDGNIITQQDNHLAPKKSQIDWANVTMQALHFFYGAGTILGPLIAEPFLRQPFEGFNDRFVSNNLVWPYFIACVIAIVSAMNFFILFLVMPYEQPNNRGQMNKSESNCDLLSESMEENSSQRKKKYHFWVILFCALFLAMFACSEGTYLQFSASFCSKTKLNLSQSQAALMASSLAISFTVFRGLSVIIAMKLSPTTMIILDLITIGVGNTFVLIFANNSATLLAIGYILLGAGFSSIFPSLFPLLEESGYVVTDWIGSLITFSSGLAQVLAPFLIGLLIDREPFVLVYFGFFSVAGSFIVFGIMKILMKNDQYPPHHVN